MGEPKILKGVFREGTMMASVVQQDKAARIMLKGAEPSTPHDPAFTEALKKVAQTCWEHIKDFEDRALCAVLVQRPAQAEHVDISPDDVRSMGLTRVTVMDGDCGIVVRMCDDNPLPTALAYASLRAGTGLAVQPGRVEIPAAFIRKTYRDLNPQQRQVFEAAAQLARDGLMKLVCLEDEGLRVVATVKDLPPARARSVIMPLGEYAADVARGAPLEEIAKRMQALRAG